MIYFLARSWSVSTLIGSLDLDISHLVFRERGTQKIMKATLERVLQFLQMVFYLQRQVSFNSKGEFISYLKNVSMKYITIFSFAFTTFLQIFPSLEL